MNELLALGGPKNGEWLPDYEGENRISVAVINPATFTAVTDLSVKDQDVATIHQYRKERLGDPATRRTKMVYVYSDTSFDEALDLLRDVLVKAFINME